MINDGRLPPRLAAIADMVPQPTRLADVGTDHALLPIWLLRQSVASWAVATDINAEPLSRAQRNAAEWGVENLDFRLCDGLDGIPGDRVDTVVIAGLGGENIAGIIARAPWLREGHLSLLQPMTRAEVLRRFLLETGYAIEQERLVEDTGRLYSVLAVRGGAAPAYTAAEYYTGRFALVREQPLFPRLLTEQLRRARGAVEGLSRSQREDDRKKLEEQRAVLEGLEHMRGLLNDNGA